MYTKKHQSLITLMVNEDKPRSAKYLAVKLEVSTRSINAYVAQINRIAMDTLIHSSSMGYFINKQEGIKVLSSIKKTIPENYNERVIYIIKKIFTNQNEKINIYDLAEELFVSESTIKSDISKMNTTFKGIDAKFYVKKENLSFVGDEASKRELISYALSDEAQDGIVSQFELKEIFGERVINTIVEVIKRNTVKYSYYINDFSFLNLIMHLAIQVNRIQKNNSLSENSNVYYHPNIQKLLTESDIEFIGSISRELENELNINLNSIEQNELITLLKGVANPESVSKENLSLFITHERIKLFEDLLLQTESAYFIDLSSEEFAVSFFMHLNKMIFRIENQNYISNPAIDTIKKSGPLIYDIAIFISILIKKSIDIVIPEDEIGFLALHLGAEINRKDHNLKKLSAGLLCPNIAGLQNEVLNKLRFKFGDLLYFTNVSGFEHEIDPHKIDVLFTTIPNTFSIQYETIFISPYFDDTSDGDILNILEKIKLRKRHEYFKINFNNYFDENLFFVNPQVNNEIDAINLLVDAMESIDNVPSSFREAVMKRERAASTAFFEVAIPHSVEANAYKSSVAVIVSKNGIKWGNNHVKVVLLVAMNEVQRHEFKMMYEAIIDLFSSDEIMKQVMTCTTFIEFSNVFLQG